ncbi:MAG: hypothetical protein B6I17_03235 [Tenericutes bacterium 4572_104]|nr:MAG: hypothetical protein B6I17_03235 [Tenericutes bacterium 4572_104]
MPRKIPMRKCVITNQRVEKKLLFRIVKTPDGTIIYDRTGKANGRGAYLTKSKAVIEKAKKTQILNRHLETEIPDSVYRELLKELENE